MAFQHSNKVSCLLFQNGICPECTCEECNHSGHIARIDSSTGYLSAIDCRCSRKAVNDYNLKKSGLFDLAKKYTFDSYLETDVFTSQAKKAAFRFCEEYRKHWFFIGGQSGCGKTHLCTAICNRLSEEGLKLKYFKWVSDSTELKAVITDSEKYQELRKPCVVCDVLYIDDLFKIKPKDADIKLAYDLLNERYNTNGCTIISSEHSWNQISEIDNAIGGRIMERCRRENGTPFIIQCESKGANYRLNPIMKEDDSA